MKTATQGLNQTREQDLDHQEVPADLTLRVKVLESLLVEKGLVDPAALEALIEGYENKVGPRNFASAVPHPRADPACKHRISCFKAAAVHAAPIYLDREATLNKACDSDEASALFGL